MKLPCPVILTTSILLGGLSHFANGVDSNTYYFKHFSTSGTISPWYKDDNSWGVNAPDGTGFTVMVTGEDWGTWSPVHTLPKKLKDLNPDHKTWFSQNAYPAQGAGYDACYDIFIDPSYAPTDRNSQYEVMIWVGYQAPNSPLSDNYDSNGAVPWARNVNIGGKEWDVYLYHWPSGGALTMTYVDATNAGWFSGSLMPFFQHGMSNGWYSGDHYLTSVMAGWEFNRGNYEATSWGAVGF
ncbi:concanavalin A-like lectin/glucanase domain-containing protein [Aspergillus floccosus]